MGFSGQLGSAQLGAFQLGAVPSSSSPPAGGGSIEEAGGVWWWGCNGVPLPPGVVLEDVTAVGTEPKMQLL